MPRLNDGLEAHNTPQGGAYHFSATRIDDLGASEYTLASVVCDVSPSVAPFYAELTKAVKQIVRACQWSPRADNLLIRMTTFSGTAAEVHGFKLLEKCHEADYDDCLRGHGGTALYDAAVNAIDATRLYARDLFNKDFGVNGIVFVLTDGEDNSSTLTAAAVADAIAHVRKEEALESLVTVLIGVNVQDPAMSAYLRDFHRTAGFTQYVELDNADAATLAKLADFVSRSISAQSQSLGTGGASTQLTF